MFFALKKTLKIEALTGNIDVPPFALQASAQTKIDSVFLPLK
jgi:hypothetical protein